MNWDVFFYEAFAEEAEALRRFVPPGVRAGFTAKTIQEHGQSEPESPLISIRTQSVLPPEWSPKIRAILSRSTGYDHLTAYRAATGNRDLLLGYLPLYCNRAVAEQAMLLWTGLARRLPAQLRQFQSFHRDHLTGSELRGKSLLVVGAGHIGGEIIRIGQGLDMRVWAVDPVRKHAFAEYVDFETGIRGADIVVCAMNLTPDNRHYFNYARFAEARPGLLFVNIARGELSPPADLVRLLRDGRLGGVGLDVYDEESRLAVALRSGQPCDHPSVSAILALRDLPNVILTPHNAFNTLESVDRKAEQSIQQVSQFLAEHHFLWAIPE
jgi:D-lactate dehydrogenase